MATINPKTSKKNNVQAGTDLSGAGQTEAGQTEAGKIETLGQNVRGAEEANKMRKRGRVGEREERKGVVGVVEEIAPPRTLSGIAENICDRP